MRKTAVPLVAFLATAHASAQHCEPPVRSGSSALRATARFEAGRFDGDDVAGWYEGVAFGAFAREGPLRARASLPYYRLLGPSGDENGFGDLDTKLEWAISEGETWALGPGISASFPTGDAEARLGMGHVMLAGTAWVTGELPELFASAELGYGRALGGAHGSGAHATGAHAHQGGVAEAARGVPIPNPMNREEATFALRAMRDLSERVGLGLGLLAAWPISDEDGTPRVTGMISSEFQLGRTGTSVGSQVDLAGAVRRSLLVIRLDLSP